MTPHFVDCRVAVGTGAREMVTGHLGTGRGGQRETGAERGYFIFLCCLYIIELQTSSLSICYIAIYRILCDMHSHKYP